jgi:hypothetical protein
MISDKLATLSILHDTIMCFESTSLALTQIFGVTLINFQAVFQLYISVNYVWK